MTAAVLRNTVLALLALLLVVPAAVQAEESVKIGFVDMNRALNESAAGKKALESLKAVMEDKKSSLEQEKVLISTKKDELDKQGLLLNESARRDKEEEIRRLERDHQRRFSDIKEELASREAKFTNEIRTELLQIIFDLGKESGYLLVLEKQFSAILYAPDSIDMTDKVIKRYDEWKSQ